ncbi:MAG TPA: TetR/AcrR family transcriptional regulator [Candidatus Binatia bacterium]|nr:TetR/AcrR family transcriptional regulator [Candidatus Binatia bacterium]
MRTSLREAQRRLTRERLLESALRVFRRRGFIAATLDEIAADAEVNRGTIYLHFANKAEILSALATALDPGFGPLYEGLARARTRAELGRAFDGVLRFWDEQLGEVLVLVREASFVDASIADFHARWRQEHTRRLGAILEGCGVPPNAAEARAFAFVCMAGELIHELKRERLGPGRAALRDALVDLFEAGRTYPPIGCSQPTTSR